MTAAPPHRPGRLVVSALSLAAIAAFVAVDLRASGGIDPFGTPLPVALGSGAAPDGAHCSAGP